VVAGGRELQQERTRLSNRIRQQLCRYYPQVLELGDDIAAAWLLNILELAPTPAAAAGVRPAAVARALVEQRIRRIGGREALKILRRPAVTAAPDAVEAAVAHIRLLAARTRLVNAQIKEAHRTLTSCASGSRAAAGGVACRVARPATRRSCARCQAWAGSSWRRC
jgi:hypothetical protein